METFGQIIGIGFAVALLILAFKLYANDKIPSAVLVVWASVLILLCSFPWFQGWAKSFIASNISSQLTALGAQVNTVQATTTEMHKQLDTHQAEIAKHQKELNDIQAKIREAESNVFGQQTDITNQYHQLSMVQSDLATAQTNLNVQAKQLADVEYWANNLYGKMTNQIFSITDTNNLMFIPSSNGAVRFIARLDHIPIKASLEQTVKDTSNMLEQRRYMGDNFTLNISVGYLQGFDTNNVTVGFHYVIDDRETNYYHQMPKVNQEIWIDSNSSFRLKTQ